MLLYWFFIIKLIYLHCKNFCKYRKVVGKKVLWPNNHILPKPNVFCEHFDVSPEDCWGAMSRMIWEGPQEFTQGNLGSGPAGSSPLSVGIRAAFEGGFSPWQKGFPWAWESPGAGQLALSDSPRSSWHLNPDWMFSPLSSRIPLRLIRKEHRDTRRGRLNDRPGHCRGHPACISVGWLTVRNPFIFSLASIFFLNVCSLLHTVLPCRICPTLCDPMDCSMPGFSVLHSHLEFAETQVHWASDALQPSHPLLLLLLLPSILPSIRVFSMSQLFASGDQSTGASASASGYALTYCDSQLYVST